MVLSEKLLNDQFQQLLDGLNALDSFPIDRQAIGKLDQLVSLSLIRDRYWLRREFKKPKQISDTTLQRSHFKKWKRRLTASLATVKKRQSPVLSVSYPEELPITQHVDQIKKAINQHQVVIVAGETGSGKTTQLPKMCIELGRGIHGRIGHTQPRRLAARTVASRIAEECGVGLGEDVGYQFRFQSVLSDQTRIKLMTDGILLAEVSADRYLNDYDTLIIDEAHERSLNIDFLLGFLKKLLAKRNDLKLIVTSATIDVQRFSKFFNDAPVIHIEGRSYPVRIEYVEATPTTNNTSTEKGRLRSNSEKPLDASSDYQNTHWQISVQLALDAIEKDVEASIHARDVLIFLSGEQQIRELSQFLRGSSDSYEVLPLYARLSQREQQRIFSRSTGGGKRRRVVLSTNVAETSLTVPGIGYVIDTGVARVSRYSARSKLQRLPIEAISQASASQRAGRCGRVAPGVCYRLYSEEDYLARPQFTEPEIRRTNLAAVILQMQSMGLGAVDQFPFVEAPHSNQVRAGAKGLQELGALDASGRITSSGRYLAKLPVDPKLAKILLSAAKLRCLDEALVIVSALSVQDPRESPYEKRQAADQQHRRFWHKDSDFLTWLNLWYYVESLRVELSRSQFRRRCERGFLNYLRIQEWRNVHWQLKLAAKALPKLAGGVPAVDNALVEVATDADDPHGIRREYSQLTYEQLHRSILSGMPLNVGNKDVRGEYKGTRSLRFFLFPGSSQFKPSPKWVLSAEIVETKKIYARHVANIDPQWIAQDLTHLVKHNYGEPYWHARRGQVVAKQTTLFFGLTVAANHLVSYQTIDLAKSYSVFIQQALVEQNIVADNEFRSVASFWQHNFELIQSIKDREEKFRRRDLLASDEVIYAWYAARVPDQLCTLADLVKALRKDPSLSNRLSFSLDDVLVSEKTETVVAQFPDQLKIGDWHCVLRYEFSPGQENDGITARIPVEILNLLPHAALEWLVPGMVLDKCIDMLKLLPKVQRKRIVPIPDAAKLLLSKIDCMSEQQNNRSMFVVLAQQLRIYYELSVDVSRWSADCQRLLNGYHVMRVEVLDENNKVLKDGRNTIAIQSASKEFVESKIEAVAQSGFRREGITEWDFGELAIDQVDNARGISITGYPVLLDEQESVTLDLMSVADESHAKSCDGIVRLAMLAMKDKVRFLKKGMCKDKLQLFALTELMSREELIDQILQSAVASACFDEFGYVEFSRTESAYRVPRDKDAFESALQSGGSMVIDHANRIDQAMLQVSQALQKIGGLLQKKRKHFGVSCDDIDRQLATLFTSKFLSDAGFSQIQHYPRYTKAIMVRLERMSVANAEMEVQNCKKLASLERQLEKLLYNYPYAIKVDHCVRAYRWMLEELRVSIFAQQLKTAVPVSFSRLAKAWQRIDRTRYPFSEQ